MSFPQRWYRQGNNAHIVHTFPTLISWCGHVFPQTAALQPLNLLVPSEDLGSRLAAVGGSHSIRDAALCFQFSRFVRPAGSRFVVEVNQIASDGRSPPSMDIYTVQYIYVYAVMGGSRLPTFPLKRTRTALWAAIAGRTADLRSLLSDFDPMRRSLWVRSGSGISRSVSGASAQLSNCITTGGNCTGCSGRPRVEWIVSTLALVVVGRALRPPHLLGTPCSSQRAIPRKTVARFADHL